MAGLSLILPVTSPIVLKAASRRATTTELMKYHRDPREFLSKVESEKEGRAAGACFVYP
jgi:hypothetical protein